MSKEQRTVSQGSDKSMVERSTTLVTWDGVNDPKMPKNWSALKKWSIVVFTTMATFTVSFGSSVYSSTTVALTSEFNASDQVILLGITLYIVGFAFGPLIWGPASELYGRTLPLWTGLVCFCLFQVPFSVARNLETILVSRFLEGLFGSAPLAIVAGMYVDFLSPNERGVSVSVFSVGVFAGPVTGPIIGSVLTEELGWRWTGWITLIFATLFTVLSFIVTPESSEATILRRKAARIRKKTGDTSLRTVHEEHSLSFATFVQRYLTKPVKMLVTEPILVILTLYMSLVYGVLYLTLTLYPLAFVQQRGWSPITGSLPFLSIFVGIVIACITLSFHSIYYIGGLQNTGTMLTPEHRLPPMVAGSFFVPIGLLWFAWTSDPNILWIPQVISGIFIGCGVILVFMSATAYLIEVYLQHVNSAMAINVFIRSIIAAVFPIISTYIFITLGIDWGASLLGFISVALIPFPIVLLKYGVTVRNWSKFAK